MGLLTRDEDSTRSTKPPGQMDLRSHKVPATRRIKTTPRAAPGLSTEGSSTTASDLKTKELQRARSSPQPQGPQSSRCIGRSRGASSPGPRGPSRGPWTAWAGCCPATCGPPAWTCRLTPPSSLCQPSRWWLETPHAEKSDLFGLSFFLRVLAGEENKSECSRLKSVAA